MPLNVEPYYMTTFSTARPAAILVACGLLCAAPVQAQSTADMHRAAKFLSHEGNVLYLSAGVLLPLAQDGHKGRDYTLRAADALGTATLFSEGLKAIVREKRPDTDERNSFPSGHATAAFAVATMQFAFHHNEAPYWYAGAALIGASRVGLHRHYIHDVLAGAALGYATARWELSRPRGLLLSPFIRTNSRPQDMTRGITFGTRF